MSDFVRTLAVDSPLAAVPLRLPIRVAVDARDAAAADLRRRPADLPRVVRRLLKDPDGVTTPKAFAFRLFAPKLSDADLSAFLDGGEAVRAATFPFAPAEDEDDAVEAADIVYETAARVRALRFPDRAPVLLGIESTAHALVQARTRLAIVQYAAVQPGTVRDPLIDLEVLGARLVEAGLPAFLAVGAAEPEALDDYLAQLFAGLTHDQPLDAVAQPSRGGVTGRLIISCDGAVALRLRGTIEEMRGALAERADAIDEAHKSTERRRTYFHADSVPWVTAHLEGLRNDVRSKSLRLDEIAQSGWLHEGDAFVPLAELHAELAREPDPPSAAELLRRQPRVLNAALAEDGADLDTGAALKPNAGYVLDVQIGPVWKERRSIVSGASAFPEDALPRDGAGHVLDVVFVSEDTSPPTVERRLWLPESGPSHPWRDGERARDPNPVSLPFRIATAPERGAAAFAGRLSVFFEHTLLQSAAVQGEIRGDGARAGRAAEIAVDYAVTGSLSDIAPFEHRELKRADGTAERHGVGLVLVQNGDAERHRIIAKGGALPAVWRSYDPQGNTIAIQGARTALLERLKQGSVKSFAAFRDDLDVLARLGSSLYDKAFAQLGASDDPDFLLNYLRKLDAVLQKKTVIQVAYSGLTQYVFPWALVYDYRMDRPDKRRYCDVIGNGPLPWADAPRDSCPYGEERWHEANVLCPYGFWGFRHIVEQPLSALPPDATDDVLKWGERKQQKPRPAPIGLTVGVTQDAAIAAIVADHVKRLGDLAGVTPPGGATSLTTVEQTLREAELLYFLCHGRRDAQKPESYIAIGATGDTFDERIYPSALFQWARRKENVPPALQNGPLVVINGCHTAELTADDLVNFVQTLSSIGATGVIGTEVSVPVDFATGFALALLKRIVQKKQPVGQAIYETRWEYALRGNLLGLVYTPYGFADLTVVS